MKKKITLAEIDNYLRDQFALRPDLIKQLELDHGLDIRDALMLEDNDKDPTRVSYFTSCVNSHLITRCENENFSFYVDLQSIEIEEPFKPEYLNDLIETGNLVMAEYDNELEEGQPNLWEEYDLSGDDDVDYNGSYLLIIADCITMYFLLKGTK